MWCVVTWNRSPCRRCQRIPPKPGTTWVELRQCLVWGRTKCCESSERRHATAHYRATGHAVMANQSGGPAWGWCYEDGMPLSPDQP
jgi:monovalent cation/hydrogen antiporter